VITGFDIGLFLAVLLAMWVSKRPKQFAVEICAITLMTLIAADYVMDGVDFYYFALTTEGAAFTILMVIAVSLPVWSDRFFFRLMAAMFLVSCLVTWMYLYDWTTHSLYVGLSHAVALLHVGIMLGYADGVRNGLTMATNFLGLHHSRRGMGDKRHGS